VLCIAATTISLIILTDEPENRAADPTKADIFERAHPFTAHYWSGSRAETWSLDLLVVDSAHWRKGYGRELVHYGCKFADEEGVCASLVASEAGDPLYVSCGFKPVGWCQEGEGNPLNGLPGGRILFRDPVVA
jgi:GNAT superfamily N-acetyltransferase